MLNYQEEKYFIPNIGFDEKGNPLDKTAKQYADDPFAPYSQFFIDSPRGVRVGGQNIIKKVLAIEEYKSSAIFNNPASTLSCILEEFPLWNELCKNEQEALTQEAEDVSDRLLLSNILIKHAVRALLMRAIYPQKEIIQKLSVTGRERAYQEIEDFIRIWRQDAIGFYALARLKERVFVLTRPEGTFTNIYFHKETQKLQAQSGQPIMMKDPNREAESIYLGRAFSAVEAYSKGDSLRARVAAFDTSSTRSKILTELLAGFIEVNGNRINLEEVDEALGAEYGGYGIIEYALQAEIIRLLARLDLSHYPKNSSRIVSFHQRAAALVDKDGKILPDQKERVKVLIKDIFMEAKCVERYENFSGSEKNRRDFFEAASKNKGYILLIEHLSLHVLEVKNEKKSNKDETLCENTPMNIQVKSNDEKLSAGQEKRQDQGKKTESQPASGFWEKIISRLSSMPKPIAAVISFLSVFIGIDNDNVVCESVVKAESWGRVSMWNKSQSGNKALTSVSQRPPSPPPSLSA
jgi:hypothetical protein